MPKQKRGRSLRGNLEPRGENVWRIRIFIGLDANGKQKYVRETFHGTKSQATVRMTELLRQMDTGAYVEPVKMTVGDYLKRWLQEYVRPNLRPKTITTYERAVEHISTRIGHLPLQSLRPLDIQTYYRQCLEGTNGGKLSPTTVNQHHRVLHVAMETAVEWGLVARNVIDAVKAPKARKRTGTVWTNEELARFLEYVSGHRLYALYALVATTGLRRGEVCGLRRQDVNLDNLTIRVQQTIVVDRSGHYVIQEVPKTEESEATLSISPAVAEVLRDHLRQQAKERLQLGPLYQDNGFLFAQVNGKHLRPDQLTSRDFPNLCKKAGVPRIRFHDLRHTYATKLLNDRIPPQVVQKRMRHTRGSTTIDLYGHVLRDVEREAAAATDDILPKRQHKPQAL